MYIVLFVLRKSVLLGGSIDNDNEEGEAMVSRTLRYCVHEKRGNHLGVYKMLLNDRGSSINDNQNGQGGRHGCGGRLTMVVVVVVVVV